jgi:hypothetical protein
VGSIYRFAALQPTHPSTIYELKKLVFLQALLVFRLTDRDTLSLKDAA